MHSWQSLDGRTILVTGAHGFLGSCIVRQLATNPCTIRRLSRRVPTQPLPGGGVARVEDIVGDVRERETWSAVIADVDVVIHLAAQTSVYVAAADPDADLSANVRPVLHLAQACRVAGRQPVVIFAGAATEVGLTTTADAVGEARPDCPITIYDRHKLIAEQYLEAFTREGVMSATTLRLANVYGPGPTAGSSDRGFLNAMMKRALAGEPLTVYGAGEYVRDYVYVDDVTRAFVMAPLFIDQVKGRHFLVGSGRGTTIRQALECVSRRVADKTGRQVPIQAVDPPMGLSPIEQRHFVADTRALQQATGWHATVGLEEGIDRTIAALCGSKGDV